MSELETERSGALLLQGERLVLRAVRLLALEVGCNGLKAQFEHACGCSGAEAYCAVAAFVAQLRLMGRRNIVLGPPASCAVAGDEALILGAFGCAQHEDYPGLNRRLALLVGSPASMTLGAAACLAAQILAMNGLILRAPSRADDAAVEVCRRTSQLSSSGCGATTMH